MAYTCLASSHSSKNTGGKIVTPAHASHKRHTYDPDPEHTAFPVLAATNSDGIIDCLFCHPGNLSGPTVACGLDNGLSATVAMDVVTSQETVGIVSSCNPPFHTKSIR